MSLWQLHEKVVIVTGASAGIGEATARRLHHAGACPVLAARRSDRLADLSKELGGTLAVVVDVTEPSEVQHLVDSTIDRYGRIDGLVNNAGVSLHHPLADLDLELFTQVLQLNVVATMKMMQAVLPSMTATGSGRIVNVSSGTTRTVPVGVGGYAATKAAVNMLTAVARAELHDAGIVVSLVVPSITATEFGGGRYQPGQSLPRGRIAHSADYVAQVILRALRTGEECIDLPHGPELPDIEQIPSRRIG